MQMKLGLVGDSAALSTKKRFLGVVQEHIDSVLFVFESLLVTCGEGGDATRGCKWGRGLDPRRDQRVYCDEVDLVLALDN